MISISTQVLIEAMGGIFILGGVKVAIAGLEHRVVRLEKKDDGLDKAFVPRSELELALRGIERSLAHLQSMVRALVYSGGNKEAAIKEIEAAAATEYSSPAGEPVAPHMTFDRKVEIFAFVTAVLLAFCVMCAWSLDHEALIRAQAAVEVYQRQSTCIVFTRPPER